MIVVGFVAVFLLACYLTTEFVLWLIGHSMGGK